MGNFLSNSLGAINRWTKDHIIKPIFGDDANINIHAGTSIDTLTEPEQQRMQTTAYMENGGNNMFGNTTAYDENKKENESWWDRNKEWITDVGGQVLTGVANTALSSYYNKQLQKDQNAWNAEQAELNRQFNANEAEKARQYETQMSNTAHQRELTDLLAAGLNPTMTGTGGGGAATGSGNAASGSPAAGVNPAYMGYTDMANTALSMSETMKALKENRWISNEKKAQIANTEANTLLQDAQTSNTKADTTKTQAETENLQQTLKKLQEETRTLKANNDYNDTIQMSDNAPQNLRFIAATLHNTGVHENLNPDNTAAAEDIKNFMKWCEKHDLGVIPKNNIGLAWKAYKAMNGKK